MMILRRGYSSGAIPATMKRLTLTGAHKNLAEAKLEVETVPVPSPREGEVLVKMSAAAVNPSDYSQWMYAPAGLPAPQGIEGAGVVVAGDAAPAGTKVGIVGLTNGQGTWGEYVTAKADAMSGNVYKLPDDVPTEEAASFFVNPYTALGIVDTVRAQTKNNVFVHTAAASQLGQMMVKLALEDKDLTIINVVRRDEQAQLLTDIGAEHVVVADESDRDSMKALGAKMKELKCTCVFDALAGKTAGKLMMLLPNGGKVFSYGGLSGPIGSINPADIIYNNKQLNGWLLHRWMLAGGREVVGPRIAATTARAISGLNGGWSSSAFKDTTIETMHGDLLNLMSNGATGTKLRIRF